MSESPNLALPYLEASQAQKHITHNEALRALDALVQLAVKDRDLATPPGSPAEGDRYIVAAGPTGAWSGHAADIAIFQDGAWDFHDPKEGWRSWVEDENVFLIFNGTAWVDWGTALGILQNLSLLGVGTTADATNPFSAKLNKALWTAKYAAEGGDGDLRYTLNKETATDVLSLLMQRGFSGRAELGLIGDDDLLLKVSPNGSSWFDALRVDRNTGSVVFPVSSPGGLREKLTGARTYYVRTDGSDSNTGLTNSTGGAFLTVQKAVDTVAALDLGIHQVTVQIGNGTFTENVLLKPYLGGLAPLIQGNTGTPASVVVNSTGGNSSFYCDGGGAWRVESLKVAGADGLRAANGGIIKFSNIDFGACTGRHIFAEALSRIAVTGNYAVSGGANVHAIANGALQLDNATVTFSNSPAFATAFAYSNLAASVRAVSMTFVNGGTVTGPRYFAGGNGVIFTNGGGASYLPGSSAGSTATGGQYI